MLAYMTLLFRARQRQTVPLSAVHFVNIGPFKKLGQVDYLSHRAI